MAPARAGYGSGSGAVVHHVPNANYANAPLPALKHTGHPLFSSEFVSIHGSRQVRRRRLSAARGRRYLLRGSASRGQRGRQDRKRLSCGEDWGCRRLYGARKKTTAHKIKVATRGPYDCHDKMVSVTTTQNCEQIFGGTDRIGVRLLDETSSKGGVGVGSAGSNFAHLKPASSIARISDHGHLR